MGVVRALPLVGFWIIASFFSVGHAQECMSQPEIYNLNRAIACQQLLNPQHCSDFSNYFDFLESTPYRDRINFDPHQALTNPDYLDQDPWLMQAQGQAEGEGRSVESAQSGLTLAGAGVVLSAAEASTRFPPVVRAHQAMSRSMAELTSVLRSIGTSAVTEAQAARISTLVGRIREAGGRFFTGVSSIPARLTPQAIQTALARVARVAGVGARVAGGLAVTGALFIYELGNYATALAEEANQCTAEQRNSYERFFICQTERCNDHYTSCSNAFNFTLLDPEYQAQELNSNPRLCSYMRQVLNLSQFNVENVELLGCADPSQPNSAISLRVNNYVLGDLSASGYPGFTSRANPQSVSFKFYTENGRLTRATAGLDYFEDRPLSNAGGVNEYARAADFYYGDNGDLTHFNMTTYAHDEESRGRFQWPYEFNDGSYTRGDLIPPNHIGWGNGIFQSRSHINWQSSQTYLFHRTMSQAYHEARRCCEPQEGETCRLQRSGEPNQVITPAARDLELKGEGQET